MPIASTESPINVVAVGVVTNIKNIIRIECELPPLSIAYLFFFILC